MRHSYRKINQTKQSNKCREIVLKSEKTIDNPFRSKFKEEWKKGVHLSMICGEKQT